MTRERKVDLVAGQVMLALDALFDPLDRDFVLEEIVRVCRARRSRSKSSRYHLDFAVDAEPPTLPDVRKTPSPDIGDRETRRVNVDEIAAEIAKSKKTTEP